MIELTPGQQAETRHSFAEAELAAYRTLTGDRREGAVPEALIAGMFSFLLGTRLPGPGTNYLRQRLQFHAPASAGEELIATVAVTRLRPEKALVNLATRCVASDGRLIADGEALVLVADCPS